MLEFLMWLRILPGAIKKIFGSAKSLFLIGVIQNLYYMMAIPAVAAVYYLYKALEKAGIVDRFMAILKTQLAMVQYITVVCFNDIANLKAMFACMNGA